MLVRSVAAGAAAMDKCLGACSDLLARAAAALYKHVLVPIGTGCRGRGGGEKGASARAGTSRRRLHGARASAYGLPRTCWCRSGPLSRPGRRRWASASARAGTSWRAPADEYKHVLVPIGTAVAAGAAATYKHVLVPIGTAGRDRGGGDASTTRARRRRSVQIHVERGGGGRSDPR